ncbi:MAG TPA: universal stress protein [Steroidobacteraceae bacterium]
MYRKILVAVDGSAPSLRGLMEAIGLAKAMGSQLRLVHVVNEYIDGVYGPGAMYYDHVLAALREAGAGVLKRAVRIVQEAGLEPEHKLIEIVGGRVADQVVKEATDWPADLIVLGTHGRRGLKRLALGSDAELVLRRSPVPVLLVREEPEKQ